MQQTIFTETDIQAIKERGSNLEVVEQQIENFKKGFPFLELIRPAVINDGIIKPSEKEFSESIEFYKEKLANGLKVIKFIPASGAASRMFKALFAAKSKLANDFSEIEVLRDPEVRKWLENIDKFAFYHDLKELCGSNPEQLPLSDLLLIFLTNEGLNYGGKPKGLLKFHSYPDGTRTPFEEHCIEGINYAQNAEKEVNLHFTVSPSHLDGFKAHFSEIRDKYEKNYNTHLKVEFSFQKPETDTIAVDLDNDPFRDESGELLFRPGGHGALISNLNDLDADLIFIKNIDNVVPDYLKQQTTQYKQSLAGLLLSIQQRIFNYQQILDTYHYYALDSDFFHEAANFLEKIMHIKPVTDQYYTEKEDLYQYLKSKFNRPIRICGMVPNSGEPGGGPFWVKNNDGTISLQIAEGSQINHNNPDQEGILKQSTHFNPVDIVCGIKNYKGEKFDLTKYTDPATGFISKKSKDGKDLKAQELPGLWNGAMADWNTIFVEVPAITFNPVKTINDLLRKEHQPE